MTDIKTEKLIGDENLGKVSGGDSGNNGVKSIKAENVKEVCKNCTEKDRCPLQFAIANAINNNDQKSLGALRISLAKREICKLCDSILDILNTDQ